jgi:hypothetical protein
VLAPGHSHGGCHTAARHTPLPRTACTTQHPARRPTYTLQAPRSFLSHTCQGILNWDPILEPLYPVSLSLCNPIRTSPLLAQKTIRITFVNIGAHPDITFVGTRTDPLVSRAGAAAWHPLCKRPGASCRNYIMPSLRRAQTASAAKSCITYIKPYSSVIILHHYSKTMSYICCN